jgi:16S rRNA (uracil1498-N3)-methyltransferase
MSDIIDISEWLSQQQGLRIFLDPYAEHSLADLQPENLRVTLLSGPEGGFSESERQLAKAVGFIPVRMGARILRTETAVLSALTAVQTLWGDFR